MSKPDQPAPFADNWAYLKTELNWLDRVLMMAVSRQKRELQEVDDFATSMEDRVTSHWWKGIIAINRPPGYDTAHPPKANQGRGGSYTQQLEARIQASQQKGIVLALPQLKDQLQLNQFEKNVILMTLAPEINQRFGRIYSYLQYQHDESDWDLPTVNLCLRLLCRNDQEWRRSRPLLTSSGRLLDLGIVEWINADDTTLLSRHLRVNEEVASYLLSETPDPTAISHLLGTAAPFQPGSTHPPDLPDDSWNSLILPEPILAQLGTITETAAVVPIHPMVLFHGEAGTGKTKAARVMASHLGLPLITLDLGAISLAQLESHLEDFADLPACILQLKSAQHWFGRSPMLEPAIIRQLLDRFRNLPATTQGEPQPGLVILTTRYLQSIRPSWRQQVDGIVEFPYPDEAIRKALWQQVIPKDIGKDRHLSWTQLARQLPLTGGQIVTLGQTAITLAHQAEPPTLTVSCLNQALAIHHPTITFEAARAKPSKRRKHGSAT
jgi:hypothetical protein